MNRLQNIPLKGNVLFLCDVFLQETAGAMWSNAAKETEKLCDNYEKREEKTVKIPR